MGCPIIGQSFYVKSIKNYLTMRYLCTIMYLTVETRFDRRAKT